MARDAYDIICDLHQAGVYLRITNGKVRADWKRGISISPGLLNELKDHKEAIVAILGDIPAGCPVPHICGELGICPREIDHSACTMAVPVVNMESEQAA